MILIIADQFDSHADLVQEKLVTLGKSYFRFNLDRASLESTLISYDDNGWGISSENGQLSLNSIKAVWMRRAFVDVSLEDAQAIDNDFRIWRAEWNKTLAGMYLDLRDARWLNPIREAFRAENKYVQMQEAKKLGLRVPETIVSNQKPKLVSFAEKYGEVALKLMSQDLYVAADGSIKGMFVNKITASDLADFAPKSENPIVLQQYIDKLFEVRYTVVGNSHHVCRIDSQSSSKAKVDWRRYDLPRTPHSVLQPPEEIRLKVTELMSVLGLEFGAMDFIVSKSGEWYFLEVNPMGQWLWIEDLTGLPISDSIVSWLAV